MVKVKEIKGNIAEPSVEKKVNEFIRSINHEDVLDVAYNTNLVRIEKADGETDVVVISSVLITYED